MLMNTMEHRLAEFDATATTDDQRLAVGDACSAEADSAVAVVEYRSMIAVDITDEDTEDVVVAQAVGDRCRCRGCHRRRGDDRHCRSIQDRREDAAA
jgi:hypothetical protein